MLFPLLSFFILILSFACFFRRPFFVVSPQFTLVINFCAKKNSGLRRFSFLLQKTGFVRCLYVILLVIGLKFYYIIAPVVQIYVAL